MSLSQIQEPGLIRPVNNPLPIVYGSSFSGEDGFRYKVELLTSGGTLLTEVWIYPDTDYSNYCIYDFSMLMSDNVGSNKDNWNASGYTDSWESTGVYKYRITEYIGITSGSTTTSDNLYTFRGVVQYGTDWDYTSHVPAIGRESNFLSNKSHYKYKTDEWATINTFTGNWDLVVIDTYNGDYLVRYTYENTISWLHLFSIITLPIGPANLNLMSNGGSITNSGTTLPVVGDLIDDSIVWYEIHLQNGINVVSETIKIYVDQNCYKHNGIQFLYLGELSTYETFSARMADIKGFNTKRSEVKTNYNKFNGTTYGYEIGDRGRSIVNITNQEEHEVLTDWILDNQVTDLMELFNSPDVYIIVSGEIYPIIITTKSYEQKTVRNNRLFNYKIGFDLAFEKLSNI